MEKIIALNRVKLRFLTKGAAAIQDLGESDSRILEVNCHFDYRGHDLGAEKDCVMVLALTEDLDSIKDSILERFQHMSTTLCHVTLRLLWLGEHKPSLFNSSSPSNGGSCKSPKCRTLTPLNVGPWLRHWKEVEGESGLKSRNRIKAELNDAVENEGEEAGGAVAGRNHPKSPKKPRTKQSSTGRAQKGAKLPSKPDVVPPRLGYSGWEGVPPRRRANSQTQNKKHDNAIKRSQLSKPRKAALLIREGDVIGSKAPALGQDNKGRAMMEKMGWTEGTGLGAPNKQCNVQPISQVFKISRAGLGASRSWDKTLHDRDLPPGDDSMVNQEICRMGNKIREEVGDESRSDDNSPSKPENLPKADEDDDEREALIFLATIPLKRPQSNPARQ